MIISSSEIFEIGPFAIGLGMIIISILILIYGERLIYYKYNSKLYEKIMLPRDDPKISIFRFKTAGVVTFICGILVMYKELKILFDNI